MLVTLSALASEQTKGTEHMMDNTIKFLNYCITHPNSTIQYKVLDMILQVHSDTSDISESKACTAGQLESDDNGNDTLNSAILASTSIMKPVFCLHWKLKSARYLTTARKLQHYILHLQKWDGCSQQHQFKLTTLQHVELPTITSSYSGHVPWICVSSGWVITANRDIFIFSGNEGPLTLLTTS
jgi:hypothetical protein